VEWVVPNERERLFATPNDPLFAAAATQAGQWWLFPATGSDANALADRRRGVAGIQPAWDLEPEGAGAVVAVLDTGVTVHPDLASRLLPGHDFVSLVESANDGDGRDADPSDPGDWIDASDLQAQPALYAGCDLRASSWHGTRIAGIVAAVPDNGLGVAGASRHARVLPVRVAGKCGAELADIVDAMRWAAGLPVDGVPPNPNPARVVTLSFGGNAACNAAYQGTIDELAAVGTVVVAAAGNAHGAVARPANCRGVVGVAALNRDGFKATYSNFGPGLLVATAGGDPPFQGDWGPALGDEGLLTIGNEGVHAPLGGGYAPVYGTSFAAPVAAGVVAQMLALRPSLGVDEVLRGLRASARPHVVSSYIGACAAANPGRCLCGPDTCGAGILDAEQALRFAQDPAAYVAPVRAPAGVDNAEVAAAAAQGPDRVALAPAGAGPADGAADAGGGGALQPGWLLALAAAGCALWRRRRAGALSRTAGRRRRSCPGAARRHARRARSRRARCEACAASARPAVRPRAPSARRAASAAPSAASAASRCAKRPSTRPGSRPGAPLAASNGTCRRVSSCSFLACTSWLAKRPM
jgi:serine protease